MIEESLDNHLTEESEIEKEREEKKGERKKAEGLCREEQEKKGGLRR